MNVALVPNHVICITLAIFVDTYRDMLFITIYSLR